ncbi:sensor histidine kinase [Actinomadura sp. 9N215]|uniref:sensor histidine kinase n=1 Tax=Actinomadura sp. 9N215 TaxID=3375150 RepID=UPI0037B68E23
MRPLDALAARLRRVDPRLVDLSLAVLVMATQLTVLNLSDEGRAYERPWWGYLLSAATAVPLLGRRRAPFLVLAAVGVAAIVYENSESLPSQPIHYGVLLAVYTVADRGKPWERTFTLVTAPLGALFAAGSLQETVLGEHFPVLTVIAAYALGAAARTRRIYAVTLEERARALERERAAEAERAAARERARIAADMHDILGHAVSLMVIQAEAGRAVVRTDPDRVETVLAAIGDAGRDAMAQLRRLLGLLKADAGNDRRPASGSLEDLVEQVRAAGLEVRLKVAGTPRPMAPDADVAAYRIVQEALTNTVKHAGRTTAEVRLSWTPRRLRIEVADRGRGGRPYRSGGQGLVGIRERAQACGGTAQAGPGPDGVGFVVTAELPAGETGRPISGTMSA